MENSYAKRFQTKYDWLDAGDFPRRITVELTNHCNLSCTMCPRRFMKGAKGYMSFFLFSRIVDQISAHEGTVLVPFFRGESLLHPEFLPLMTYAKKKGIGTVQFATNGTLMTEEKSRQILDLGLDFISFSVDSVAPLTYGKIRRGADLDAVLKHILLFCDLKKSRRLAKPQIQVSMVKTRDTAGHVSDFVEFWKGRVDRVRIYEEHSQSGQFGSLGSCERVNQDQHRKACCKPFTDLVVYWNGSVALCNHDWDRKSFLGDANKSSLETIWHGQPYQWVRKAHLEGKKLRAPCRDCDHWRAFYEERTLIGDVYERTEEDVGKTWRENPDRATSA